MKEVLVTKSNKFIVLSLFGCAFCFLASIISIYLYIIEDGYLSLILFLFFFSFVIFFFNKIIKTIKLCNNAIEYDEYGIYLNYNKKKKIYIRNKDIDSVYVNRVASRYKAYEFGDVKIYVGDKTYKIGVINDVKKVEQFINKRIAYKMYLDK